VAIQPDEGQTRDACDGSIDVSSHGQTRLRDANARRPLNSTETGFAKPFSVTRKLSALAAAASALCKR
jgi:hypothetical protein